MSMQEGLILNKQNNEVKIETVPIPAVEAKQVLVKVKYSGICGTDIKLLKGHYNFKKRKNKVIIGHEFVGTVIKAGGSVTKVSKGERVTAQPTAQSCEECKYCKIGQYNLCQLRDRIGFDLDGSFSEYIVLEENQIFKVPENISDEAAVMIEPLSVAVRAIYKAIIKPTDTVLITGPGAIGLLTLIVIKQFGCRVLMCGTKMDKTKLEIASSIGADKVFINDQQPKDMNNETISVVFECSGQESAINMGLELIQPSGQFLQIGTKSKPVRIDFMNVAYKELCITGSIAAVRDDWINAMDLMERFQDRVYKLIDKIYPLKDWEIGIEDLLNNGGPKILLQP